MRKRVMILEDDLLTLECLSKIIKKMIPEAEIKTFTSMEGVYETVMQQKIDLFVIDIIIDTNRQGDTSGIQFIDKIRGIPQYEFTPVIFVTSLEDPKLYAYSELHSFGYIEKPFDPEYVKNVVKKAMRFSDNVYKDNTLFFRRDGVLYSIKCSEILYAESVHHKMYFHRIDGREMVIPYKTCRNIIEEADCDNLIQCSRSSIINKDYVEYVDMTNKYIKMKATQKLIDIGSTFQNRIKEEFMK